jgi:hypothetical protein
MRFAGESAPGCVANTGLFRAAGVDFSAAVALMRDQTWSA